LKKRKVYQCTNIKGLWSLLGEHVEDLFGVGDSVDDSEVFVPAAQLSTDVIQSNSLVSITLKGRNKRRRVNKTSDSGGVLDFMKYTVVCVWI